MGVLESILDFFSGGAVKASLGVETNSERKSGSGQTGNVKTKNGNIIVDNSVHNHYHINMPPNIGDNPDMDEIKEELLKRFNNHEVQFLVKQSDEMIVGYKDFEKKSEYKETLDFFEGKIQSTDMQFLRTGLYIRYLSDNNRGDESRRIKDGAIRNNPRARNIINLASDGYFESYIKPIYENNDIDIFKEEYEEVVNSLPEIIFVNNNMTVEKVMLEIEDKLSRSEQYHIKVKCIMISGLNQSVEIIRNTESEIRNKYPKYKISLQTNGSAETLLRGKMCIELPD